MQMETAIVPKVTNLFYGQVPRLSPMFLPNMQSMKHLCERTCGVYTVVYVQTGSLKILASV